MSANGHNNVFQRVCVRCHRPMLGHGFRTVYGYFVRADGKRIPVSGEALHDSCPPPGAAPREIPHEPLELGEPRSKPRTTKNIEHGIDLQQNGRYAARAKNKRLGTYLTLDEARTARDAYLKDLKGTTHESATHKPIRTRRERKAKRRQRK